MILKFVFHIFPQKSFAYVLLVYCSITEQLLFLKRRKNPQKWSLKNALKNYYDPTQLQNTQVPLQEIK
jgi:hypothetical protein